VIKGRIEALAQTAKFDVITSRAFSSLPSFVGVCLPLLEEGGYLLAMKGVVPTDEIGQLDQAQLNIDVIELNVPFLHEERHLIVVKQKLSR
jgi:16S rRNA (guanine527-N7)-methyltransferase